MHEMSLVRALVESVSNVVERNGAKRATEVWLTIGAGRDVVKPMFADLFDHLSKGTVLEGAELIINETPYLVRCNDCGMIYHVDIFDRKTLNCPRCQAHHYSVHSGKEFEIDRIVAA